MGGRRCACRPGSARGFTLAELLTALVVLGILAAVAAPRFLGGSAFQNLGLADETRALLRYAQRSALARQRTVCVGFTATSATLTYASAYGSAVCDAGLPAPSGSPVPYQVAGRGSAAFSPLPANFSFDRLGRPSAAQSITIAGAAPITVEAETGYVH